MIMKILDPHIADTLIRQRRQLGSDKYDEVWDGVYVMSPLANNIHQAIVATLTAALYEVITEEHRGVVLAGANVSDRHEDWEHNYRCPDIVVVRHDGHAIDRGTHWQGGPDFLVEVLSPGDDTLAKLPFYSAIAVQELLTIDRDSRHPTLYRLCQHQLQPIPHDPADNSVTSIVVPLRFRQTSHNGLHRLEIQRTDATHKTWTV